MKCTRFAVLGVAALSAGALQAEGPERSLDPLMLQQQIRSISAQPADDRRSGMQPDMRRQAGLASAMGSGGQDARAATQQSRQREQARLRLERRLDAQADIPRDAAAGARVRSPGTRFGVGYEARMSNRQGAGVAAPGGLASGARAGGRTGGRR